MKMKKFTILFIAALLTAGAAAASQRSGTDENADLTRREIRDRNTKAWNGKAKYAFGLHTGIDIGAAAPWPLNGMGEMNMSAVPKLNPALGVSFTTYPWNRFTLTVETTWKQVGIDAKARVAAQRFTLVESNGDISRVEFRGTAYIKMAFSMLEIPLYAGYSFGDGRNRVFAGGYYSRIFRAEFETTPQKGVIVNVETGTYDIVQKPEDVPAGTMPEFREYLDDWDAGFLVGYQWQVFPRIDLSARFSMGLKDIFKPGNNYLDFKMFHMRGTVSLSYSFLRYSRK